MVVMEGGWSGKLGRGVLMRGQGEEIGEGMRLSGGTCVRVGVDERMSR